MWDVDNNAESYDFELATDNAFSNIVVSESLTTNSYSSSGLRSSFSECFPRKKEESEKSRCL